VQHHILAVDDDPAMRKLVADYLHDNDLRVTAVRPEPNGAGVPDHAIDLVVLDLRLVGRTACSLRASCARNRRPIIM